MTSVSRSDARAASDADQAPSWTAKLAPACTGFVVGILFWHCVGFWSLVSEMVFSGPRPRLAVASTPIGSPESPPTPSAATIASVAKPTPVSSTHATCMTISQDRPGGPMRREPCPVDRRPVSSFDPTLQEILEGYDTSFDTIETGGIRRGTSGGLQPLRENQNEPRSRANTEQSSQGWATSLSGPTGP